MDEKTIDGRQGVVVHPGAVDRTSALLTALSGSSGSAGSNLPEHELELLAELRRGLLPGGSVGILEARVNAQLHFPATLDPLPQDNGEVAVWGLFNPPTECVQELRLARRLSGAANELVGINIGHIAL